MAAGLRAVVGVNRLVDVVVEVRDARLPKTTAVAHLHPRLKDKTTIVLLNRADLAEPAATRKWLEALHRVGMTALSGIGTRAGSLRGLRKVLLSLHGSRKRLRIAVVGAPNTGKSSVINALIRRKAARAMDRPGVTRQIAWIPLDNRAEVLDTPGVLEPRIASPEASWQLAMCGVLPESAFDMERVALRFAEWLAARENPRTHNVDLEVFARSHGMLLRGGEPDRQKAARGLIKNFRAGKLGRITFENP